MTKKKTRLDLLRLVCVKCKKEKEIEQFHDDSLCCKKCHSKQVGDNLDRKHLEFLTDCVGGGLLKVNEISAAHLLLMSCKSRYEACKYQKYGYLGIQCNYSTYYNFFIDAIKYEKFWNDWKEQSLIHKQTNENKNRASIDRIDPMLNYNLENIQVLSLRDNILKARQKPCKAMIIDNHKIVGLFDFDSRNQFIDEVKNILPITTLRNIKFNEGLFHKIKKGTYIILQTKDADINEIARNANGKYRIHIDSISNYYYNFASKKIIVEVVDIQQDFYTNAVVI